MRSDWQPYYIVETKSKKRYIYEKKYVKANKYCEK